ncbi:LCP family protein [Pseudonocardia xishanensis]|uniref:Cell envelope-related transcriptional attenuator domain-containing protein n=1 Tax=Pseudonocardia xishanensis TaxID=630995 RepID=A0ABP8S1C0_9PSEU
MRVAVAALSVLVLGLTGYGWSVYRSLAGSLATSDVLSGARSSDGATDILLVGLDSRTDGHGNPLPRQVLDELNAGTDSGTLNTDTLILLRIPDDPTARATAISIPRDSYVDIPGHGRHKVNSAYSRARTDAVARLTAAGIRDPDLTTQADLAGRRELVSTIEQLTGASVDHYAEIDLVGFAEITDVLGGVPVCLNAAARDSYSGVDLPAGPQTVQGAQALAFVRQRHGLPRGDLDRIVRQQAFMAGLAHELLSAHTVADPATLSRLVAAVDRYVVLDRGWDVLGFAARAQGLSGGNIDFQTIPTGSLALRTPTDGEAVQVDPAAVRAFVSGLTAPPAPDTAPPAAPTKPAGSTEKVTGTTRSGLTATATPTPSSTVQAPPLTAAGVPCVN